MLARKACLITMALVGLQRGAFDLMLGMTLEFE